MLNYELENIEKKKGNKMVKIIIVGKGKTTIHNIKICFDKKKNNKINKMKKCDQNCG